VHNLLDTHHMEYNDPSEDMLSGPRVDGVAVSDAHLYAVVEKVDSVDGVLFIADI
jgi:hypothetical protein